MYLGDIVIIHTNSDNRDTPYLLGLFRSNIYLFNLKTGRCFDTHPMEVENYQDITVDELLNFVNDDGHRVIRVIDSESTWNTVEQQINNGE